MAAHEVIEGIRVDGDAEDLNVEGDSESLRLLADSLASAEVVTVRFENSKGRILIMRDDGNVKIEFEPPNGLVLRGSQRALSFLADALRFTANGPQQPSTIAYHSHIDFFPDHMWLAEESAPLTVSLAT